MHEFDGMDFPDIIPCIASPQISAIPIEPGLSNTRILTENTESKIPGEGVSYYDIRFAAVIPESDSRPSVTLAIDVEPQKNPTPGYDLTTRGIYYCARMLSDQNSRIFSGNNYNTIQKVYSIWIVMNCPEATANTISRYVPVHEAMHGTFSDNSRCDLLEVIMIRLPKPEDIDKAKNPPTRLHSLLSLLFSTEKPEKKCEILEREYGIQVTSSTKEDFHSMCNLSEIILEEGIVKGKTQTLYRLVQKGLISAEDAADDMGIDVISFKKKAAQSGYQLWKKDNASASDLNPNLM